MKILITGASRGIGRAIAELLSAENHQLILIARKSFVLSNHPENSSIIEADLSLAEGRLIVKDYLKNIDELDVIINNVGWFELDFASEINLEKLKKTTDLNVLPAIDITSACIPLLERSENGNIINIGSVMSMKAALFAASYSISKHALKGYTDALREELRSKKIKVCGIYPGAVNTSSWDGETADTSKMIQPESIANLVSSVLKMDPNTLVEEIKISPSDF